METLKGERDENVQTVLETEIIPDRSTIHVNALESWSVYPERWKCAPVSFQRRRMSARVWQIDPFTQK